jgi:hypothetical protein
MISIFALSLAASACTAGPSSSPASSTSTPAPVVAGIPATLWNQGTADALRPIGLSAAKETSKPVPLISSYQQGVDHIGAWRLLAIDDKGEKLVIQYSQGFECEMGKGVLVAQTESAVALVPLYQTGSKATPCHAILRLAAGTVTLDKPLGSRKLLHLPGSGSLEKP